MKKMKSLFAFLFVTLAIGLFSCSTIPQDAVAVQPFDSEKYLGKWYEIARIDFKFFKELNKKIT